MKFHFLCESKDELFKILLHVYFKGQSWKEWCLITVAYLRFAVAYSIQCSIS